MNSIKNFCKKHIYFFCFFSFILIYNCVVVGFESWGSWHTIYSFYLVDYSMGFCSKMLPGVIYNFLFDDTSLQAVYSYCVFLYVLFIFLVVILLEKLVKLVEKENRSTLLFILLFFISGTLTFSAHVRMPGSHDFYWLVFAVLSLLCLSDKHFYIFIIPLSLLAVMVNYGYLVSYFLCVVALMIYKTATLSQNKDKIFLWIIIVLTVVLSLLLGVYFLLFERDNLKYTVEEFCKILESRGFTGENEYYRATLYNIDSYDVFYENFNEKNINDAQTPIIYALATVYHRILIAFSGIRIETGIFPFLLALPCVAMIILYLCKKLKNETNKTKVFSLICLIPIFFVIIFISIFLSTDIIRFICNAYTGLFGSFLFLLYFEKGDSLNYIRDWIKKIPPFLILVFLIFYLFSIFDPIG